MASFDIIEAAGSGYREAWRHRLYLARLALAPLVIDVACGLGAMRLDDHGQAFLRQGIVGLPAMLALGWMLSHYARLLLLGQRWPFRPTGDAPADRAAMAARMRGIGGGALLYALIRFAMCGLTQLLFDLNGLNGLKVLTPASIAAAPPPTAAAALAGLVLAVASFWGIRLAWLFIPASVGLPLGPALRAMRGFGTSLYIAATALVCYLPLTALMLVLVEAPEDGRGNVPLLIGRIVLKGLTDIVIGLVLTGGVTQGMRDMFGKARQA